jgi:hypothetical protein
MSVNSNTLVPDLQYWFEVFIKTSNLNKDMTLFPPSLYKGFINNNSFIRLLFDDNWPTTFTTYQYMFYQVTNLLSVPENYRTRLMVYPSSGRYFNCIDSTAEIGINLFNLQMDDIILLNSLLSYRLDSTSTTIIDIDYNSLTTNLSKLIYTYLDLKINKNYANFDSTIPISSIYSVIENCYEMYVCETLFDFISNSST